MNEEQIEIEHQQISNRLRALGLVPSAESFAPNMQGRFFFRNTGAFASYDIRGGHFFQSSKDAWIASGTADGTHNNQPSTTAWSIEYDGATKKLTWSAIFERPLFDLAAPDAPIQVSYNPADATFRVVVVAYQVNFGVPNKKLLINSFLNLSKCVA